MWLIGVGGTCRGCFASLVGHTTLFLWKELLKLLMSKERNMLNDN
jgi:hypothetical protein